MFFVSHSINGYFGYAAFFRGMRSQKVLLNMKLLCDVDASGKLLLDINY